MGDKAVGIGHAQLIEPLHIGLAEVDGNLLHRGEDDQHVGVDKLRQLGTGPILVDHRTGTAQVIALPQHRNAAATDGDHHLTGGQHGRDGLFLDDIYGFGRCDHSAIATAGILFEPLALGHQRLGLLLAEEAADGLARVLEGGIVFIHLNLGHQSGNRLVDAAFQQGFTQGILQVITDITLTQGHADRHGQMGGFGLVASRHLERLLNHPHLRPVAVGHHHLVPLGDQVGDSVRRALHRLHLLGQVVAQRIATKGQYDSLFHLVISSDGTSRRNTGPPFVVHITLLICVFRTDCQTATVEQGECSSGANAGSKGVLARKRP